MEFRVRISLFFCTFLAWLRRMAAMGTDFTEPPKEYTISVNHSPRTVRADNRAFLRRTAESAVSRRRLSAHALDRVP